MLEQGPVTSGPVTPGPVLPEVDEERVWVASQWRLMWWRFRKHKLALVSAAVVALLYLLVLLADFVAYADPHASDAGRASAPPQAIHWFQGWRFSPYVHPVVVGRDPETFKVVHEVDDTTKVPIRLFAHGFDYKLLGIIPTDVHLIGVANDQDSAEESIFVLGTDAQGRDLFSRLVVGLRTSLTIGLLALAISIFLGVLMGGISGYYGGVVDTVIQRFIEILSAIPVLPLYMGLAAAMPREWSVYQVYLAITIIISLIGWRSLARDVRGRFLSVRNEDYVTAAELSGCGSRRIIFTHMTPAVTSHLIATATLALPGMVAAETALSFLGIGLRPPGISLGVLLQQAQNIQSIALAPWLMLPALPLILFILAFNFLGDGLRDAADPYGT